jgi:hypothetical protein
MLEPKNPINNKNAAEEKSVVKKSGRAVRDLRPRKNPSAGGGLYPKAPPLSIPPEGFIKSDRN